MQCKQPSGFTRTLPFSPSPSSAFRLLASASLPAAENRQPSPRCLINFEKAGDDRGLSTRLLLTVHTTDAVQYLVQPGSPGKFICTVITVIQSLTAGGKVPRVHVKVPSTSGKAALFGRGSTGALMQAACARWTIYAPARYQAELSGLLLRTASVHRQV